MTLEFIRTVALWCAISTDGYNYTEQARIDRINNCRVQALKCYALIEASTASCISKIKLTAAVK